MWNSNRATRQTRENLLTEIDKHLSVMHYGIYRAQFFGRASGFNDCRLREREKGLLAAKRLWVKVWKQHRREGNQAVLIQFTKEANRQMANANKGVDRFHPMQKDERSGWAKAISLADKMAATALR